jgi:predicted DNA-binding protein
MQTITKPLVRKQFLISPEQVEKLSQLAEEKKVSAAEIVRNAINAYNPDFSADIEESELLDLVSARVKETIAETRKARKHLDKTLKRISSGAA